jgi:hypothetical protein
MAPRDRVLGEAVQAQRERVAGAALDDFEGEAVGLDRDDVPAPRGA